MLPDSGMLSCRNVHEFQSCNVDKKSNDSLFDAGVLPSDPDPARAAREQRPRQDDLEARQDNGDRAAPHLADTDGQGVDEGRGAAQGSHPRRQRQEKQVRNRTLNSTVSKSGFKKDCISFYWWLIGLKSVL